MRTYKYRISPTEEQKVLIEKHLWCCRFVWNTFLWERKKASEILIKYQKEWGNIKVWKEGTTPYQDKRKNTVIDKAMKEILKSL